MDEGDWKRGGGALPSMLIHVACIQRLRGDVSQLSERLYHGFDKSKFEHEWYTVRSAFNVFGIVMETM